MTFKKAFAAIIALMAIHACLLAIGAYFIFSQLDVPMHILGGAVAAVLGIAIHHSASDRQRTRETYWWYHYLFVTGFAMLIGTAWEFHEYIMDNTINVWYSLPMSQLSLEDTMGDFLMDWIGATITFFAFRKSL
jgi:membrane-bound ClpP family serine protease